jgi:hypothetical protein
MCTVTPIAIKIKIILTKRMVTIKKAENIIVIHKKEIDNIFTFNGIPFPSQ